MLAVPTAGSYAPRRLGSIWTARVAILFIVRRRSDEKVNIMVTKGAVEFCRQTDIPEAAGRLAAGTRGEKNPVMPTARYFPVGGAK